MTNIIDLNEYRQRKEREAETDDGNAFEEFVARLEKRDDVKNEKEARALAILCEISRRNAETDRLRTWAEDD